MNQETKHEEGDHKHGPHQVRIHIDRQHYHSPNPTKCAELYALAKIPVGNQLYRETHGDREDDPVFNDTEEIHLKEDEHFYSTNEPFKGFAIIVNARKKVVQKRILSFAEIVALAFETPPTGPNIMITVTFRKAAGKRHEGTLAAGEAITIKNGTIFDVTATDKS